MKRYCSDQILADLSKKMVFIGGPRQVGKTTLSKSYFLDFPHSEYFNWDVDEDRQAILKKQWKQDDELVIFDEIHKFTRWKQWIKGVYDIKPPKQNYIVTGSARLDVYRRSGDSLMGRYHYWRLHPLTIDELPLGMDKNEGFQRLLNIGGFPEPFILGDEREARRWRRERFDRILKEDVRDLEHIRNIQLLTIFVDALRERVGNMVTLSNIAQDLQVSPKTAKSWLQLVEKMYIGFSVYPLTRNVPRSISKPPKVYFYDNGDVLNDGGARFENFVATTLLKHLNFIEDYYGHRCSLHYIRDKEGREVDFVTIIDNQVMDLIEVKTKDSDVSTSLKYYANMLKPKRAIQLVANLPRTYDKDNIRVTNPIEFFNSPPWESTS